MARTREYTVSLHGCDDSTVVTMRLTSSQHQFLAELERLTTEEADDDACKPVLTVVAENP